MTSTPEKFVPVATSDVDRVPVKQKIAYGIGSANDVWGNWLYGSMAWPVFNIFLLVSPAYVSLVLMINRLVDVVSDPLFGWLSDNARTRWGRRRPFILAGSIVAGLVFPLLFLVGRDWSETSYVWYMAISSGILIAVVSCFNMPYQSLGAELTPDYNERTSVYSWRTILQKLPEVAMYFAAAFVTLSLFDVSIQSERVVAHVLTESEYNSVLSKEASDRADKQECENAEGQQRSFASLWSKDNSSPVLKNLKEVTFAELGKDRILLSLGEGILAEIPASALPDPKHVLKKGATAAVTVLESSPGENSVTLEIDAKGPDVLHGALIYSLGIGILIILVGFLVFGVVKERYYDKLVSGQHEKISIADTIWKSLKCRPFRAQLAMALAYGLGTSMVGGLGYYATIYYVCDGDLAVGSQWNFGMGLANMAAAIIGVPLFAFIARHAGKRTSMFAVLGAAILVFCSTWFLYNPDYRWMQLLASGGIGFTAAGFWMLYGSMMADVIDYDELETGKRREGSFNACGAWIMKVGMALGIGASGFILEATGFNADCGNQQDPQALLLIRVFLMIIPIVGLVLAILALSRFGLSPQRMADVRNQLEARRGTV